MRQYDVLVKSCLVSLLAGLMIGLSAGALVLYHFTLQIKVGRAVIALQEGEWASNPRKPSKPFTKVQIEK